MAKETKGLNENKFSAQPFLVYGPILRDKLP